MQNIDILYPLFFQVNLSFLVMLWLGHTRAKFMKDNRIHPQKVSNREDSSRIFKEISTSSDNFKNLFEIPTLFIPLPILLIQLEMVDEIFIIMAWAFVISRALHSIVHCTYNKVMHRFYAYILSSLVLWLMWLRLLYLLV